MMSKIEKNPLAVARIKQLELSESALLLSPHRVFFVFIVENLLNRKTPLRESSSWGQRSRTPIC